MADRAWLEHAACLGTDPEPFFPSSDSVLTSDAVKLCTRCPVRTTCLTHAVEHGEYTGIWGGLTPAQRKRWARDRGHARHGTITGYTRDRCRCDLCRAAATENKADRRATDAQAVGR